MAYNKKIYKSLYLKIKQIKIHLQISMHVQILRVPKNLNAQKHTRILSY